MKQVTCITINTDASFCNDTHASGYAFYAICDTFKIMKSGNFKKKPRNATEAELFCIGNAIATVLKQPELPKSNYIVVNSDSEISLYKLSVEQERVKKNWLGVMQIRTLAGTLRRKCNTPKKNLNYRHVKAHSDVKDSRSWVNEWCDKEAKKWMVRERWEIKLKQNK